MWVTSFNSWRQFQLPNFRFKHFSLLEEILDLEKSKQNGCIQMQLSGQVAPRSLVSAAGLLAFGDLHTSFYYHTNLYSVHCSVEYAFLVLHTCVTMYLTFFSLVVAISNHTAICSASLKGEQEDYSIISAATVPYSHLKQLYRIFTIHWLLYISFRYIQQSTLLQNTDEAEWSVRFVTGCGVGFGLVGPRPTWPKADPDSTQHPPRTPAPAEPPFILLPRPCSNKPAPNS